MQNPLAQFVKVEDREDGVYINVPLDMKNKVHLDEWVRALESVKATNYDIECIKDVVTRARGVLEKIGPPFEYYNASFDKYIEVYITDKRATMKINSMFLNDKIKLTVTSVIYCLKLKGIRYGIIMENVENALRTLSYDTEVVVAEAKEPVNGKNASFVFEVDFNPDMKPKTRSDGSVDFRDVHTFVYVSKEQIIARKIPPTQGEPGKSVTGKNIPPTPGNDKDFPKGKNTYVSEGGLYLMAAKAGVLKIVGNSIDVDEQLTISKDVDYSIGNIKFSGDLVIRGNIKPGFSVEAERDITITGCVESAKVASRNGTVMIKEGVLGKGDAYVYGKTAIRVAFAQEATLETDGILTIDKHCLHCNCKCNIFEAKEHGSSIVGGHINAYKHGEAYQLGNHKGVKTRISLVDKNIEENEEKLKKLDDVKKILLHKLEPIKNQVQSKAAIFKKAKDLVTAHQKIELKKWVDKYNDLNNKFKYVEQKIGELKESLKPRSEYDGYIKVSGDVFPATIINMYGLTKKVDFKMTKKVFCVKQGTIFGG